MSHTLIEVAAIAAGLVERAPTGVVYSASIYWTSSGYMTISLAGDGAFEFVAGLHGARVSEPAHGVTRGETSINPGVVEHQQWWQQDAFAHVEGVEVSASRSERKTVRLSMDDGSEVPHA